MAKKKNITKENVIGFYMDYFLEHNKKPNTVYQFAKLNNFGEAEFYKHFTNFETIDETIFEVFFEQTLQLLQKSDEYETYDAKTKLLSFYYTFFEILTANRSFVVAILNHDKNQLKNMKKLDLLRKHFKNFFQSLEIEKLDLQQEKLIELQEKSMNEMAWIQFALLLKFWIDDTSSSFEKTDIFIEKSVNASFDLMDIKPLKSLFDLGKFMWKEKVSMKM
ncbi:TetR family transcriptional regulator C-terminal domain-containing protein [Flavobacterium tibetense]|uniref:TetR/AcrR family transcriptional regulator n=1 Tax=Flavobacterium tibetense TaxID=2233533 RepID=A0A365P0R6_9FLAO|nr:TetR family transcriptional regulator C-terminal domain-containing protein [Flavobacterium tibetense]RBA28069.1 TetR/AcrR family transcriptional regulator [Flavobacterium tibetense]